MIAKLIGIKTYRYTKEGTLKEGTIITITDPEYVEEDNGDGNARYGYESDTVALPPKLRNNPSIIESLKENIGRNIDLIYVRNFGSKFLKLDNIEFGKEG